MTYRIGAHAITLVCNGCGTTIKENKDGRTDFDTTRAAWTQAASKGWTSSSTRHLCRTCS